MIPASPWHGKTHKSLAISLGTLFFNDKPPARIIVEDVATYLDGSTRIIHVARPNLHMGYLLKESWITGGQTVTLRYNVNGTTTAQNIPLGSLAVQPIIKAQTRELSGDPELEFAAMVYFTFIFNTWGAAVAHSPDD